MQDAAERLGVSDRRVRALIESGRLRARRAGSRWLIDEAALRGGSSASRPMSARMAWAFLVALSSIAERGDAHESGLPWSDLIEHLDLAPVEQRRLNERIVRLLEADDPALLLRSWLPKRAQRQLYSGASEDVAALLSDDRLVRSGVSHSAAGISISDELEGYVAACDEGDVVAEYLLSEVAPHNVVLHVVADDGVLSLAEIGSDGGVMFAAVLADLADRGAAREDSRVLQLLARVRCGMGEPGL